MGARETALNALIACRKSGAWSNGVLKDYILRDRDDCLNVFIHANKDYRADRIVRLYGESEKKPFMKQSTA